jgi:hypothetical protein
MVGVVPLILWYSTEANAKEVFLFLVEQIQLFVHKLTLVFLILLAPKELAVIGKM